MSWLGSQLVVRRPRFGTASIFSPLFCMCLAGTVHAHSRNPGNPIWQGTLRLTSLAHASLPRDSSRKLSGAALNERRWVIAATCWLTCVLRSRRVAIEALCDALCSVLLILLLSCPLLRDLFPSQRPLRDLSRDLWRLLQPGMRVAFCWQPPSLEQSLQVMDGVLPITDSTSSAC